ncbi:MAG: glycoside hydrolase family 5 protein [Candidatus Limnocylindrales bacterium]
MTRRKRLRSVLGAILVVWLAVGCSAATATPYRCRDFFPRRFHVEGPAFKDQSGQKMIFRGMAIPDPVRMRSHDDPTLELWNPQFFQAAASWGANIIRVPITPSTVRECGWDQTLTTLDQTIAWAGANKMYVIIDFHSVGWFPDPWFPSGNETSVVEWTDFWNTISSRYAGNDVVAFYELFNEPALNSHWPYTGDDWLAWKGLVEPLINNTIRPSDPDKIILVGGLQSAYDLEYVAGAPIADVSNNVAYATHPYSHQILPPNHQATRGGWDQAYGNLSSKYPVFATEFGYEMDLEYADDPIIDDTPYHQAIIDYLEAHHISWSVWCFSADWATRLLKNDETFEPSESGAYFKSRLLELNGPPSP